MFTRLTKAFDLASDRYPNSRKNRRRRNVGRKNRGKNNGEPRLSIETLETRQMLAVTAFSDFSDDFSNGNTIGDYAVVDTSTNGPAGPATFVHNTGAGGRAQILSEDNEGLRFSKAGLTATDSGAFSIDFTPTVKHPIGGEQWVRLVQDANNYYEVYNTDGYGPGTVRKVVGGADVETGSFTAGYSQDPSGNTTYAISVEFSPTRTTINAFNQQFTFDTDNSSILVDSFEVESFQQDAYFDDIFFGPVSGYGGAGQDSHGGFTVENSGTTLNIVGNHWKKVDLNYNVTVDTIIEFDFVSTAQGEGDIHGIGFDDDDSIEPERSFQIYGTQDWGLSSSAGVPQYSSPGVVEHFRLRMGDFYGSGLLGSNQSLFFMNDHDPSPGSAVSIFSNVDVYEEEIATLFFDDFSNDTTASYVPTDTRTDGGVGSFSYNAAGERVQVTTGDNIALQFAHGVTATDSGQFSIDFNPTVKFPFHGEVSIRLVQDADNYYEIHNTTGGTKGAISKFVNGNTTPVETVPFANYYAFNTNGTTIHTITIDFSPTQTTVNAFGETLEFNTDSTPITVSSFEVENEQQTAFYDNILLTGGVAGSSLADQMTIIGESGNFVSGFPASALTDGPTTTSAKKSASSFFVEYDLGQLYDLTQARLYGDNEFTSVSTHYSVEVKASLGDSYQPVAGPATVPSLGNSWFPVSISEQARYVKVTVFNSGSGATEANEFELFGTVAGSTIPDPVGQWKLDEMGSTLTAIDSSVNGNDGTLTNGPVWTTGRINNGLKFDGANDFVNLGDPAALEGMSALTVSAWVNLDDLTSDAFIIGDSGTDDSLGRYRLWFDDVGFKSDREEIWTFSVHNGTAWYQLEGSLPATTGWMHVVGVFDGSNSTTPLSIYVDGKLDQGATHNNGMQQGGSEAPTIVRNTSANHLIGMRRDNHSPMDGIIDELNIYNTALTEAEIVTLHDSAPVISTGDTYYVDDDGTASGDGSLGSPFKTIGAANAIVQPGDTVYLRAGNYAETIRPAVSGTAGQYITYAAHPGETPVITNVTTAVNLNARSYIRINGIKIDGVGIGWWADPQSESTVKTWVSMWGSASYNIIENNIMQYAGGDGVQIRDGSHHNQVLNNIIRYAGSNNAFAGVPNTPHDLGEGITIIDGHHNLVEGNDLSFGGHNLLKMFDTGNDHDTYNNIVRNNNFHSGWERNLYFCGDENVFEDNIVSYSAPASDSAAPVGMVVCGTENIVRRNLYFNNEGTPLHTVTKNAGGLRQSDHLRIYNNVFHGNNKSGIRMNFYEIFYGLNNGKVSDNILKNNVVLETDSSNNSPFIFFRPQGAATTENPPLLDAQFIGNNLMGANGVTANIAGIGIQSLTWFEANYPSNFSENIQSDPMFVDPDLNPIDHDNPDVLATPDFHLMAGSPNIDAGVFVTQTTQAGSGQTITVSDASYFTDGFGIIAGDVIQLEGQTQTARITSITGNTIALDTALSWSNGLGISLAYVGSKPDIGAFEYGASSLSAAEGEAFQGHGTPINATALAPIVEEATRRWEAGGFDTAALENVDVSVGSLGGDQLAARSGNNITIDTDAAGYGWFVDRTPGRDNEYVSGDASRGDASRRMDLLTAVSHELGHILDLPHDADGAAVTVMHDTLEVGQRRTAYDQHGKVSRAAKGELLDVALAELAGLDTTPTGRQHSAPARLGPEAFAVLGQGFALDRRYHHDDLLVSRLSRDNERDSKQTERDQEEIFDDLFADFEEVLAPQM